MLGLYKDANLLSTEKMRGNMAIDGRSEKHKTKGCVHTSNSRNVAVMGMGPSPTEQFCTIAEEHVISGRTGSRFISRASWIMPPQPHMPTSCMSGWPPPSALGLEEQCHCLHKLLHAWALALYHGSYACTTAEGMSPACRSVAMWQQHGTYKFTRYTTGPPSTGSIIHADATAMLLYAGVKPPI